MDGWWMVDGRKKVLPFCSKNFQIKFTKYKCAHISVFVTSCLWVEKNQIWRSKLWKFKSKFLVGNRHFFVFASFHEVWPVTFLKPRALKLLTSPTRHQRPPNHPHIRPNPPTPRPRETIIKKWQITVPIRLNYPPPTMIKRCRGFFF